MANGPDIKIHPNTELTTVQDTTKSVAIQYYPSLELVLITPTTTVTTTVKTLAALGVG